MNEARFPIDRHTLYGLAAILLWSATIAMARSLTERVGILTAASSVYLIGGAICLGRFFWLDRRVAQIRRLPRRYLGGCGVLFITYMLALYLALGLASDRTQAVEIGMVNYLWPALTILFSLVFLNKKANFFLLPGTLIALAGVFLVLSQGTTISWASLWIHVRRNPWAYVLGLVAAFTWGLYSNLTRRWAGPGSTGAVDLFIPATGLVLLGLRLFFEEGGRWNVYAAAEAAFLGLATLLAYAAWDLAMRKGNVVLVAAFSYLTPLFSALVSYFYLRIEIGFNLWTGCALIVAGSLLSWISVSDR